MQKQIWVYEMLFTIAFKPNLNVQSDFIRAKVFFIIFAPSYVNSSRQSRFQGCDFIFPDNGVMTTPNRRILSFFFVQNEINEIKMTEDGISFLEDESKTQIKTPSNWTG